MQTIDGTEIPSDEFIRGVRYTLMQLMDTNYFEFFYKEDRKTINANVLLEAIWFNVIDFCLYGANCKFRYVKWDENHKPTKAVYIGGGDCEHQQKCLKFLTQLALDGLTLKDLEEWQNQKLQTEAK